MLLTLRYGSVFSGLKSKRLSVASKHASKIFIGDALCQKYPLVNFHPTGGKLTGIYHLNT
jgi:hypothetical protein